MSVDYFERVHEAAAAIRARAAGTPDVAIVLGSGLGEFASRLKEAPVS
jgi:purine nucleoside phosphorylase